MEVKEPVHYLAVLECVPHSTWSEWHGRGVALASGELVDRAQGAGSCRMCRLRRARRSGPCVEVLGESERESEVLVGREWIQCESGVYCSVVE